jgi:hypothetical protein
LGHGLEDSSKRTAIIQNNLNVLANLFVGRKEKKVGKDEGVRILRRIF